MERPERPVEGIGLTVSAIYQGSNGEATSALYAKLGNMGLAGVIAINLFRACKTSERAKVYRGGRYRRAAYDTKNYSITNLDRALSECADLLGIRWGWKQDPAADCHAWVLYVDLPTGQVSFHALTRLSTVDYPGDWDRQLGQSPDRIIKWVCYLLD